MRIESQKHRLDVRHADLSGSRFDDVSLSGSDFHDGNMSGSSLEDGATIDGLAVSDLLAYWRARYGATGA